MHTKSLQRNMRYTSKMSKNQVNENDKGLNCEEILIVAMSKSSA